MGGGGIAVAIAANVQCLARGTLAQTDLPLLFATGILTMAFVVNAIGEQLEFALAVVENEPRN